MTREVATPNLAEAAQIVRLILNDLSEEVLTERKIIELFDLSVRLWPHHGTEQIAFCIAGLWAASRGNVELANFFMARL